MNSTRISTNLVINVTKVLISVQSVQECCLLFQEKKTRPDVRSLNIPSLIEDRSLSVTETPNAEYHVIYSLNLSSAEMPDPELSRENCHS